MAYFECLHEVKLIVDLIYEGGIANMNYSISNTAEYGEYKSGPRIITDETRREMRRMLADIQPGNFTRDWMLENKVNQTSFKATRAKAAAHPIEAVGEQLRGMMPWITEKAPGGQIQELTGSFKIRQAGAGEASALSAVALRSKAHWGYDAEFMADCADELTWGETDIASGTFWVVQDEGGARLGFCELCLVQRYGRGGSALCRPGCHGPRQWPCAYGARPKSWQANTRPAQSVLMPTPHAVGFYQRMGAEVVGKAPSGSIPGRVAAADG